MRSVSAGIGPAVRGFGPSLLRMAAGVTVLWFLGLHVGAAPFEDGLRAVTWQAVVAAVTLTALTHGVFGLASQCRRRVPGRRPATARPNTP